MLDERIAELELYLERKTRHDVVNSNVKRFTQNYYIPPGARLVGFDKMIAQARHLVSSDLWPSPDFYYSNRNGQYVSDIKQAAGVRVRVRLRSGPRFDRYEGVFEGTVTLRYTSR